MFKDPKEYATEFFNNNSGDYYAAVSDLFEAMKRFPVTPRYMADTLMELNELAGVGTLTGT